MKIFPGGFVRQERGPYRFDRWHWPERVTTLLGNLLVEVSTDDGEPPPDEAMAAAAEELAAFAAANGDLLLDLIYGHYRYAEQNGWLSFWNVPRKLSRRRILSQVESVVLAIRRGDNGVPDARVFVNPRWDPEHKLDLTYEGGRIVAVNDEAYLLEGKVLRPR